MVVQHNMTAAYANRQLGNVTTGLQKSTEKLSSGYRINRAADDAAGLAISEKLRCQIKGLNKASKNIEDGISLCQIADGALNETHAMLSRMNELATQAANDTNTSTDRADLQLEIDQLASEIDRIASTTSFNGDIYPLAGKYQLPDGIKTFTSTVKNTTSYPVDVNGTVLNPGETGGTVNFLAGILTGTSTSNCTTAGLTDSNGNYYSFGTGMWFPFNKFSTHVIGDISSVLDTSDTLKLWTPTVDQIQVEEGTNYLYINDPDGTKFYLMTNKNQSAGTGNLGLGTYEFDTQNPVIAKSGIKIQSGAQAWQAITVETVNADSASLGVSSLDLSTFGTAGYAMDKISKAIDKVSVYRSTFGAQQNRLEHAQNNVDNTSENTDASESRIRDTDMAEEMVTYSTASILQQAGQSMLGQANSSAEGVLALLMD